MSGNPSGHGATRLAIRVRPGSSRPGAGGSHDGALIVRVSARAVDGRATAAAIAAVADAAGVRAADIRLVSGATSHTKIIELPVWAGAAIAALRRLADGDQADGAGGVARAVDGAGS